MIADWSRRVAGAVDRDPGDPRPAAGLPAGQLLWWHRIAVNPPPGQEFPAARWYGVRADLADHIAAVVGNGFSLVWYDFLTEDDITVAADPRPAIAISVVLVTALTLLAAVGHRHLGVVRRWRRGW